MRFGIRAHERTPTTAREGAVPAGTPGATAASRLLALQSAAGNRAVATLVARQSTKQAPTATGTVTFPWGAATTYAELAAGLKRATAQIDDEIEELSSVPAFEDLGLWDRGDAWSHDVKPWIHWLETFGSKSLEGAVARIANGKLEEYAKILGDVWVHKASVVRRAYWDAELAAEKAAKEAEELATKYDDAWRVAFRSGSTSKIREVFDTIKTTLSLGRSMRSISSDFAKEAMKLANLSVPRDVQKLRIPYDPRRPIKLEVVHVNKYVEKAQSLARGLAVINIGLTLYGRGQKKPTQAEQGVKDIEDTVNLFSDIGTLVGLPPHVSLVTTAYLKPALKVISKQIGMLVNQLHQVNQLAVEVTGELMYPNAEPGGEAMWQFMKKVMRAQSVADVPKIGGSIEEFFYDHNEQFTAGTGFSVPLSGWWFWEDLDLDYMDSYVFHHRQRIWALLYGSMRVPSK